MAKYWTNNLAAIWSRWPRTPPKKRKNFSPRRIDFHGHACIPSTIFPRREGVLASKYRSPFRGVPGNLWSRRQPTGPSIHHSWKSRSGPTWWTRLRLQPPPKLSKPNKLPNTFEMTPPFWGWKYYLFEWTFRNWFEASNKQTSLFSLFLEQMFMLSISSF